ncbi:hypothetical protein F2S74_02180 [Pseudomonas syringae pv. actinidiae]|nr:hypothetical protein [Pseudomonas syringae pv. actinidiae]
MLQSGAGFNAAGCCILALCDSPQGWLSGWAVLGLGMRLSLYDALFAALAGLLGERSRPLMVQITLLGGLASGGILAAGSWAAGRCRLSQRYRDLCLSGAAWRVAVQRAA